MMIIETIWGIPVGNHIEIIIALLGIVCALLGWWGNVLWNAVKDLRQDHAALQLHLSDQYVKKDDLKERLTEVLQPIKDSLDELRNLVIRGPMR